MWNSAMTSQDGVVSLVLHRDGATEYVWRSVARGCQSPSLKPELSITSFYDQSEKGHGVVWQSSTPSPASSILYSNKRIVAKLMKCQHPSAENSYCQNCFRYISSKSLSFSHPLCRFFTFCSRQCLQFSHSMMETVGPIINELICKNGTSKEGQSTVAENSSSEFVFQDEEGLLDSQILLIMWLSALVSNSGTTIAARQCLQLYASIEQELDAKINDAYTTISTRLNSLLQKHVSPAFHHSLSSILLPAKSNSSSDYSLVLFRMLHIIRLNAQPMTPPNAPPGVSFLCLVPTIPRLNHSCTPNALLILETQAPVSSIDITKEKTTEESVQISVLALQAIENDEEITISYLDDLCLPVTQRRSLLQQAFGFLCHCPRCQWESSSSTSNSSKNVLYSAKEKLQVQLQLYFEKLEKSPSNLSQSILQTPVYEVYADLLKSAQQLFDEIAKVKQQSKNTSSTKLKTTYNYTPGIFTQTNGTAQILDVQSITLLPTLLRDAAGVVLQDYALRFQVLQQRQKLAAQHPPTTTNSLESSIVQSLQVRSGLIYYGWWFLRSGQYVALAYELAYTPGGKSSLKRLELMVMTAMYGAVTARAYTEAYDYLYQLYGKGSSQQEKLVQRLFLQKLPSPFEVLEALRGGIAMVIDVMIVLQTVYCTSVNVCHRQRTIDGGSSKKEIVRDSDIWIYIDDLSQRAKRAKRYCQTVFEKVGELHDTFEENSK